MLQSGCRIEERRWEALERLLPCVAVYRSVGGRTVRTCRLGRSGPDLNCEAVCEPSEGKAVWRVVKQEALPEKPPGLRDRIKRVAERGGYVNRPQRKDPPGPPTVWRGLPRVRDLAWAWETFGPEANLSARCGLGEEEVVGTRT